MGEVDVGAEREQHQRAGGQQQRGVTIPCEAQGPPPPPREGGTIGLLGPRGRERRCSSVPPGPRGPLGLVGLAHVAQGLVGGAVVVGERFESREHLGRGVEQPLDRLLAGVVEALEPFGGALPGGEVADLGAFPGHLHGADAGGEAAADQQHLAGAQLGDLRPGGVQDSARQLPGLTGARAAEAQRDVLDRRPDPLHPDLEQRRRQLPGRLHRAPPEREVAEAGAQRRRPLAHREALADALRAAAGAEEPDRVRAQALLALAYQVAVAVLTKLGETDLAWIASERGLAAAQQADDPVVLGSLFRSVTHALHATGRFQAGVELAQAAADVLQPHLSSRADDALLSVYGSLFLTGAIAASRAEDRQTTTAFLAEAQESANRLGRDANAMWTAFGPTHVAIHRMTAAMELGDVQVAVDLEPRVDASGLPIERRVRHAIETARAYSARNRRDDALGVMLEAEQLAPEQIKHHAISRQLVLSWLRNHRGPRSVALDNLARRLHLVA